MGFSINMQPAQPQSAIPVEAQRPNANTPNATQGLGGMSVLQLEPLPIPSFGSRQLPPIQSLKGMTMESWVAAQKLPTAAGGDASVGSRPGVPPQFTGMGVGSRPGQMLPFKPLGEPTTGAPEGSRPLATLPPAKEVVDPLPNDKALRMLGIRTDKNPTSRAAQAERRGSLFDKIKAMIPGRSDARTSSKPDAASRPLGPDSKNSTAGPAKSPAERLEALAASQFKSLKAAERTDFFNNFKNLQVTDLILDNPKVISAGKKKLDLGPLKAEFQLRMHEGFVGENVDFLRAVAAFKDKPTLDGAKEIVKKYITGEEEVNLSSPERDAIIATLEKGGADKFATVFNAAEFTIKKMTNENVAVLKSFREALAQVLKQEER